MRSLSSDDAASATRAAEGSPANAGTDRRRRTRPKTDRLADSFSRSLAADDRVEPVADLEAEPRTVDLPGGAVPRGDAEGGHLLDHRFRVEERGDELAGDARRDLAERIERHDPRPESDTVELPVCHGAERLDRAHPLARHEGLEPLEHDPVRLGLEDRKDERLQPLREEEVEDLEGVDRRAGVRAREALLHDRDRPAVVEKREEVEEPGSVLLDLLLETGPDLGEVGLLSEVDDGAHVPGRRPDDVLDRPLDHRCLVRRDAVPETDQRGEGAPPHAPVGETELRDEQGARLGARRWPRRSTRLR